MGARVKGWAQTIITAGVAPHVLNASTDTGVGVSGVAVAISDRADAVVFLVAGTTYPIRWGGRDNLGLAWGAGLAANTAAWRCDVMYETTQTSVASDSLTAAGAGSDVVDRTFNFTPTVTGTYRLKVNLIVTVTIGGAAVANDNTDSGNFGSAAPARIAGSSLASFNPGLVAVGTALSTYTPPAAAFFTQPVTTVTNQFVFAAATQASPNAAESCTLSYRDHLDVQFATSTIAATASATKTDPGKTVEPASGFPAAAEPIGLHLSLANSALSTSLSGAGIPWSHITGALPAGWSSVVANAVGATEIKKAGAFTADPRLQTHVHAQKTSSWLHTPPDPGAPAPYDGQLDDSYQYIISADLFFGWLGVFNMASSPVGQNGITGTVHLSDPNETAPASLSGGDHTTTLVTTTIASNPLGWSRQSTPYQFTPAPPAGSWRLYCETATDGTNTWSRTNGYLVAVQGNADVTGAFAQFASIMGFISAFRDNLYVQTGVGISGLIGASSRLPIKGDTLIIGGQALKDLLGDGNFTPTPTDGGHTSTIKIRNSAGVLVVGDDVTGGAAMTQVSPSIWIYFWDTTAVTPDDYLALVEMFIGGGPKLNQTDLLVTPLVGTVAAGEITGTVS